MDPFGLYPDSVMQRARESGILIFTMPSYSHSLLIGALGFGLASLIIFGTVAFGERWMYANLGLAGAYAAWTVLFIVTAGVFLSPLALGPGRTQRFFALFTVAFLLYSVGWIAAYFTIRGVAGEWLGALAGTALMALVISLAFNKREKFVPTLIALFIGNAIGYFAGSILNGLIGGRVGMLSWGLFFGLGLGVALGRVFYDLQAQTREMLKDPFATSVGTSRLADLSRPT